MEKKIDPQKCDPVKEPGPCDDPKMQQIEMGIHRVSKTEFDIYVSRVFGENSDQIAPLPLSYQQVYDAVYGGEVVNDSYIIISEALPGNTTDNSNINFEVVNPIRNGQMPSRYFTITLFRGVLNLNPAPVTFGFYKGINNNQSPTFCFRTVAADNVTMTYWDLSGAIPPIKK
jgi:hypothetical protein